LVGPECFRTPMKYLCPVLLFVTLFPLSAGGADPEQQAGDFEFFEKSIRPLLSEHCFECHSSKASTVHGGLRLDTAHDLQAGGDSGPAIVPGQPEKSLLITAVQYNSDLVQMPPDG